MLLWFVLAVAIKSHKPQKKKPKPVYVLPGGKSANSRSVAGYHTLVFALRGRG